MSFRPALLAAVAIALAAVAIALAACSSGAAAGSSPRGGGALTIFAAASLKDALEQARAAYETARPGMRLTISTDSSSTLATQIEQGAPADVFLSADAEHPATLAANGLTDGAPITFARNRLIIVVPADDPAGITSPADLARPGIKIVAAGDEVPITRYAMRLVDVLAREPGYPPDFASAYAANVVSKEDNVKAVIAKIELGEGDAGIVYATDARTSDTVATIDVPDDANPPATYDGAVVRSAKDPAAARAFLDWLVGPDGQAILDGLGFLPPS